MRFVAALCARDDPEQARKSAHVPALPLHDLAALIDEAPPMQGAEYLQPRVLEALWRGMEHALVAELVESGLSFQEFLKNRDSRWRLVGRVHFNLAENRKDPDYPFAFMATYTSSLAAHGALRHLPLGQALREYAGAGDKAKLLELLEPVQEASESCAWLKEIVDRGEIFHPLRWTPKDAMRFLTDVEAMERAGLVVRMPAAWRMNRPSRPAVEATVGSTAPSLLGVESMLDFRVDVSLDGEVLTDAGDRGAARRDRRPRDAARQMGRDRRRAPEGDARPIPGGRTAGEKRGRALRPGHAPARGCRHWPSLRSRGDGAMGACEAGPWLAETLAGCRSPEALAKADPGAALKASLRPYQQIGVRWLYFLIQLGLGACLADDMGLGKTIQVLALLLTLDRREANAAPSLLVAPASLLANWASEAARFAPSLRVMVAHPSFTPPDRLKAPTGEASRTSISW